MSIRAPLPDSDRMSRADQRLIMYNVPWSGYEAQLALRGGASAPRVSYLDGAMELTSPSRDHERLKSYVGRLVETFALERGIDLSPYGAWTLRSARAASGLIYARLAVPEVWIWRDEAMVIHVLRGDRYEVSAHSEQLPGIDLTLLLSYLDLPTALQAVRAFRAALQAG